MTPVILSGGSGTRLWPLSRGHYPKQFLPLVGTHTMLQNTVRRLQGVNGLTVPIAVCNEDHRFMLAEQLREIGIKPAAIILEPTARNTAPAVAAAAMAACSDNEVLLVLPADHIIQNIPALHHAVGLAKQQAERGFLVTFGIVANAPETGYGYIKRGEQLPGDAFNVAAFVEKPDVQTAESYIKSGEYFWNSGMFAFQAGRYLQELEKFNPQMFAACREAFEKSRRDADFIRLDLNAFAACPADSIDYAVMEKTANAVMIPLDAAWNDVGSWAALWDVTDKDAAGNAVKGDVLTVDAANSFLHAESKLLAAVGVQDLIVVETDDAVMVAAKDRVQDVKQMVDLLKARQRPEAELHRKVYRPWGYYDALDCGDRHQAKRILVKPGAKLSLQMHHHRAEHWVVVKGTALVTKGNETMLLTENQSTYIPPGTVHRLENPGVIPLEMIEVQTGSYLGEDDIVRFGDQYGRVETQ
ncbi:MAG: mannose-1-phosphate guanylyltransferase/mannose-6-phosphate isomerase [Gammaproteobacteria bacterium]